MNIFNLGRKYDELRKEVDDLKKSPDYSGQINELEQAIVDMQASHAEEIKEIRERLDMPRRSKSTMRPWALLRSVAERGEDKFKVKTDA